MFPSSKPKTYSENVLLWKASLNSNPKKERNRRTGASESRNGNSFSPPGLLQLHSSNHSDRKLYLSPWPICAARQSNILPEKALFDYQRRHFNTTATSPQCSNGSVGLSSVPTPSSSLLTTGSSRVRLLEGEVSYRKKHRE